MLSNQKDREIEHLSEQTSLSHNAKDYLRFSDPEGIGALVALARRVTKLNLPKAGAR
jgi:hypothetical protein